MRIVVNADQAALTVLDTYLAQRSLLPSALSPTSSPAQKFSDPSASKTTSPGPAFVYISAADAFRPLIPARYLETKRQAEQGIAARCTEQSSAGVRGIYMRPGELLGDASGGSNKSEWHVLLCRSFHDRSRLRMTWISRCLRTRKLISQD